MNTLINRLIAFDARKLSLLNIRYIWTIKVENLKSITYVNFTENSL